MREEDASDNVRERKFVGITSQIKRFVVLRQIKRC